MSRTHRHTLIWKWTHTDMELPISLRKTFARWNFEIGHERMLRIKRKERIIDREANKILLDYD